MKSKPSAVSRQFRYRRAILCAALCALAGACNSQHPPVEPKIEFNLIPPAGEGGPDRVEVIAGRVTGARSDQQLVLFARAGVWWVQPDPQHSFTRIKADSSWKSSTHFGSDYAALLVDAGYKPPRKTDVLPSQGGPVAAVSIVKGRYSASEAPKTLQFAGYTWRIRRAMSDRNSVLSSYDPANAETDSKGFLHLRITKLGSKWTCSEATLAQSLGYGSYLFTVRDISQLEPRTIFSIFTWDDQSSEQSHREMDVEISRWDDPNEENARYVIQPFYIPANVSRFSAPAGPLTYSLEWARGSASFETFRGEASSPQSRLVAKHVFTSGVPSPGAESIRMNFCEVGDPKIPLRNGAEIVVEKFLYLP